jgi:hypothetical protein
MRTAGNRQVSAKSFEAAACGVEWRATTGKCSADRRNWRTPELGNLRQQFTQLSRVQSSPDKENENLGAQSKQDVGNLRKQFLDHQARWNEVMKRVMQHVLFTSDPLGCLVSHLMAKCGGNVHDKGVVEITASSLEFATRSKQSSYCRQIDELSAVVSIQCPRPTHL